MVITPKRNIRIFNTKFAFYYCFYFLCVSKGTFHIKVELQCNHITAAATAAKSLQSCPTLCDAIHGSPPGSPHPWDSPGKNTGVCCHFLLQCMKVKSETEFAQSCPTLRDLMDCSLPGSSAHGIFPGKSTGVGYHCLLQYKCETILYLGES